MELPQVDALDLEPAQAQLDALVQVLRTAHRSPLARAGTGIRALGRDHETVSVGVEGFRDQGFVRVRPVGIRRVDEVDAEIEDVVENALGLRAVLGLAPNALAGEAHGPIAHAMDG